MQSNDLINRVNEKYSRMSKGQKLLATYITDNFDKACFLTASKLGKTVGVSESTVVRFATQLGYKGYPEFQVTLESIDHSAFDMAVKTILEARKIYIIGIRSCAALADFLAFYLNLIFDNVVLLSTNNTNELFEQTIHMTDKDVMIGISFPRYSMRTLKMLEFANNRNAKVITLTDSVHSPMNLYSSCNLIAKSDMASVVDSLTAPLSVINALVVALCIKKRKKLIDTLDSLEKIWDEYQVYDNDEMGYIGDSIKMNYSESEDEDNE